jgi:hypothetical protein
VCVCVCVCVCLIIRIKPFRLVLGSITDRDNQGKVTTVSPGSVYQRLDNQARKSLIISDNQAETCLIIYINDTSIGDLPLSRY